MLYFGVEPECQRIILTILSEEVVGGLEWVGGVTHTHTEYDLSADSYLGYNGTHMHTGQRVSGLILCSARVWTWGHLEPQAQGQVNTRGSIIFVSILGCSE